MAPRRPARNTGIGGTVFNSLCYLILIIAAMLPTAERLCAEVFTPDAGRSFFNDVVPAKQEQYHIPGTGVALVHNGKTVFLGGYGQADLVKKIPVDPKYTVFRCCSISKLFTVTAVMQLHERNLLDLNKDINIYLKKIKIHEDFQPSVTIGHLMTHTAGFDERYIGMATRDANSSLALASYLSRRMPGRIMPPGRFIQYSNHGLALAGLIIEDVSGMDFSEYIRKNIFSPLNMRDSSFDMPARLMERCAVGYEYRGGRQTAVPFDALLQMAPAGSLISTPRDMANFMILHLQHGSFGGRQVLSVRSTEAVHRRHFTHHPSMDGVCYDFFESTRNGIRGLYHTGSWQGFSAILYLIPEKNLGMFIAANGRSHKFLFDIVQRFHDHFFPEPFMKPAVARDLESAGIDVCGRYRDIQYSRNTVEKLASLLEHASVSRNPDSSLNIVFPQERKGLSQWVEIGAQLFQAKDRKELVFFKTSGKGKVSHMIKGTSVYERLPWYETGYVQTALFIFFLIFSATIAIGLPLFIKRLQNRNQDQNVLSRIPGYYLVIVTSNGWLNLIGLAGVLLSFILLNPFVFTRGMPSIITAFLMMLTLGSLLTLTQGFYLLKLWKNVSDKPGWEWLLPPVTLVFVLNALFLSYWNMLGLKF